MDNSISESLKRLRKKKNLSQAGLGIALGVSRGKISNWELGRRNITIKYAMKVAKYFNISLEELINYQED